MAICIHGNIDAPLKYTSKTELIGCCVCYPLPAKGHPMTTPTLRDQLKHLIRGYVNLLGAGRERILFYGGKCDSVETMEAQDPYLNKARAALAAQPELPEPFGYVSDFKQAGIMSFQHAPWNESHSLCHSTLAVYTAAQLQQAVEQAQANRYPMTQEQILAVLKNLSDQELPHGIPWGMEKFTRAIEAHHGIGDKA